MEDTLYILFDNYLENRLSDAEKENFEQRYHNDIDFRDAFKEHENTLHQIKQFARFELKTSLISIGNQLTKEKEFDDYKPNKNGGFNLAKWIKWIISAGLIGTLAYFIYQNKNTEIGIHLFNLVKTSWQTDSIWQKSIGTNEVEYDTVWQEIKTNKLPAGTKIIEKPNEKYGKSEEENNIQEHKKGKYDTIYKTTYKISGVKTNNSSDKMEDQHVKYDTIVKKNIIKSAH